MSLYSSHCREIRPSFESGHLSVHSPWGSKLRFPLTYLLLREASTWRACGKLAYLFSRSHGITSPLEMIWGARSFPRVAVLKLMFLQTWDGCLRESVVLLKASQVTCRLWSGTRNVSGANEGESDFISSWFSVHWAISHSYSDISVLLDLWHCSWGLSGVPSSKSRLLTCLIGDTELLWPQFRGIGLHLRRGGSFMVFLELLQELGVYSWVTAGIILQCPCLFSDIRTPV